MPERAGRNTSPPDREPRIGQVEDADIDRRDRDIGVVSPACARHGDGIDQRLARLGLFGCASSATASLRSPGSTFSHFTPMARIGMRDSCASPGRNSVAVT
jgi:hypothetical protein